MPDELIISNDDGVEAIGLRVLATALRELSEVVVVAPENNCSGNSHALTLCKDVWVRRHTNGYLSVSGTPTDCVRLAYSGLLGHTPNMVVSGINSGPNLSDDIFYSGTLAAAIEGRFLRYTPIAVSLASDQPVHFDTAAEIARRLVQRIYESPLRSGIVLNVNVPDVPISELKGFVMTRLGRRSGVLRRQLSQSPCFDTPQPFKIPVPEPDMEAEAGTDIHAIRERLISITPLKVDESRVDFALLPPGWLDKL